MNVRISLCIPLFILLGCKHDKEIITPVPKPVITPPKVAKVPITNLKYASDTLKVVTGNVASIKATFKGTEKGGKMFTLKSTKDLTGFSIDTLGTISLANTIVDGIYPITVEAKNNDTTTVFANIVTVVVSKNVIAPSALTYGSNKITSYVGGIITSVTPTVSGSAPFTFSIKNVPAGIKIDASTGVISSDNSLVLGTYSAEVTVKNSAGSNIVTLAIEINKPISFVDNKINAIVAVCFDCHPNNDMLTNKYGEFDATKGNINQIIERISLPITSNKMMPQGGPKLSETDINLIKQWQKEGLNP